VSISHPEQMEQPGGPGLPIQGGLDAIAILTSIITNPIGHAEDVINGIENPRAVLLPMAVMLIDAMGDPTVDECLAYFRAYAEAIVFAGRAA
jgi:hypothetical protein